LVSLQLSYDVTHTFFKPVVLNLIELVTHFASTLAKLKVEITVFLFYVKETLEKCCSGTFGRTHWLRNTASDRGFIVRDKKFSPIFLKETNFQSEIMKYKVCSYNQFSN